MAGGWGAALVAALLLSAILAAPLATPEPAALAGAVSPTPAASPRASQAGPPTEEPRPSIPHWPPPGAGRATRPAELVELPRRTAVALQRALHRARVDLGLHALALGVAFDGRAGWAGASGMALDGVTPLDGDSPFAIASITKTFTAALVLEAVEDGRLALDDAVSDYLPRMRVARGVTVRQLLQHTSGIADLLPPMREPMTAEPNRSARHGGRRARRTATRTRTTSSWGCSSSGSTATRSPRCSSVTSCAPSSWTRPACCWRATPRRS
jgi:CubicO group peptidase (beta-lactamase class C family)